MVLIEGDGIIHSILADVDSKHYFWLYGGKHIRSLGALADSLDLMSKDTFSHHVTEDKNDFAVWIKDVFHDSELSSQLKGITKKNQVLRIVSKRINQLKKIEEKERKVKEKELAALEKEKKEKNANAEVEKIPELKPDVEVKKNKKVFNKLVSVRVKEDSAPSALPELNVTEKKLDEILSREKEIEKKEEKIKQIEEKIEERLEKGPEKNKGTKFFSVDFIQGLLIGLLVGAIGLLVYVRFF